MRPNNWLSQIAFDTTRPTYTSQRGEDRILQALFAIIKPTSQWCVEFGATDGRHKSNTWYWINHQGWHSVQIEAARDINLGLRSSHRWSFEALFQRYKNSGRVICLNEWVGSTGPQRLDTLLARTALPREFDLLSIDIDGNDYAIWDSLADYSPRVVVIEHNKTIPIEINFHSDRGSSLRALVALGKRKGYELAAANDLNGILVRQDLFSQLGMSSNDPEELWQGHEQYRMYLEETNQGLVFRGSNRLRWVRGHDSTLRGQLKSGQYVVISPEITSLPAQAPTSLPIHLSGWLRHWYYEIRGALK